MVTAAELRKLIARADRISSCTRFGPYYTSPSIELTDKEILLHRKAMDACAMARDALQSVGDPRAKEYAAAVEQHSRVYRRVGDFSRSIDM